MEKTINCESSEDEQPSTSAQAEARLREKKNKTKNVSMPEFSRCKSCQKENKTEAHRNACEVWRCGVCHHVFTGKRIRNEHKNKIHGVCAKTRPYMPRKKRANMENIQKNSEVLNSLCDHKKYPTFSKNQIKLINEHEKEHGVQILKPIYDVNDDIQINKMFDAIDSLSKTNIPLQHDRYNTAIRRIMALQLHCRKVQCPLCNCETESDPRQHFLRHEYIFKRGCIFCGCNLEFTNFTDYADHQHERHQEELNKELKNIDDDDE